MNSHEPAIDDVVTRRDRPPNPSAAPAPSAREPDGETIATLRQALREAEQRAVVAERDLAFLARDQGGTLRTAHDAVARPLAVATAESERRGALLCRLRDELEQVRAQMSTIRRVARETAEHARGERLVLERSLHAQLDRAASEKAELNIRLSVCEHALREREHELARERELADEATRWASRVERALVFGPPAERDGDVAPPPQPASGPPTPLRRRDARVRVQRRN
jgi:hypothetical protein